MLGVLTQVGRMAHRAHAPMREDLPCDRSREVEVVADDEIGPEASVRLGDDARERAFEALGHLERKVAVARRPVRHHIRHPADGKRQLVGLERHGMHLDPRRERRGGVVVRRDAADDGDLVPRLLETPRGLREEHAAARAVGLLRADGEDLHVRFPPSSIDRRPMVSHRGPDRKTPDARHVLHLLQWARTMRRAAKRVRRKDSSMGSSIPYLTLDPEIEAAIRADRAAGRSSRFRTADDDVVRREPNPHDEATLARPAFARDIEKILNVPAYNRYAGKTQVFSFVEDDDICRRGLHVQLVGRVARAIGEAARSQRPPHRGDRARPRRRPHAVRARRRALPEQGAPCADRTLLQPQRALRARARQALPPQHQPPDP